MIAYAYHPQTGAYLGAEECDLCQITGDLIIPGHCTLTPPPPHVPGKVRVWMGFAWWYLNIPRPSVEQLWAALSELKAQVARIETLLEEMA